MIIPLGGGGSKVVASITVSYPAGSTCTCTLGSKVLTAKDTSGKWVFGLPSTGSWVLKYTNGSAGVNKTVSITTEGQVETVVMNALLYKAGNEFTAFTGGWESFNPSGYSKGTATKNTANLYLKAQYQYDGWYTIAFGTKNLIDVTNYSALYLNVSATTGVSSGDTNATLGLCKVKDTTVYASPVAKTTIPASTGWAKLDISSYTGQYYIYFLASNRSNSTDRTITTDQLYLLGG